jgi:hypothetical protein
MVNLPPVRSFRMAEILSIPSVLARRLPQLECRHSMVGPSMVCAIDVDGATGHASTIPKAPSAKRFMDFLPCSLGP